MSTDVGLIGDSSFERTRTIIRYLEYPRSRRIKSSHLPLSCSLRKFASIATMMNDSTTEASAAKQRVVFLVPDSKETNDYQYAQDILAKHAVSFHALGAEVQSMPWSASPPAESSSAIYVANLVWGYHLSPDLWYERLRAWPNGVRLVNSASLLLWNSRKTYLKDLDAVGIPTIPSVFVDQVDESTLIEAAKRFSTNDLIVKPQVSASSFSTLRVLVGRNDFHSAPSVCIALLSAFSLHSFCRVDQCRTSSSATAAVRFSHADDDPTVHEEHQC